MTAVSSPSRTSLRRVRMALVFAWLVLFVGGLALGLGLTFFGDPAGGMSVVQLTLTPPPAPKAEAPEEPLPQAQPEASHNDLTEDSPQGPLPRIADDGRTPMQVYAGKAPNLIGPRVAIVVSGLGISAKATQAALDSLPPAVTLAFAPYAGDVQHWASEARRRGHEVLIEIPMEPYDFPDSDPGQYTLRIGAEPSANLQRLNWALSRISGYPGTTNLLGGRFLSDGESLAPVLKAMAKRGLYFFDNGSATHSAAEEAAVQAGVYYVRADESIDTIQSAMEIDHRLDSLVTLARTKGKAAGAGFVYPVTIERISLWAKSLSGKGVVLTPLSAIVSKP